jgi:methionine-rich copper-binding protein CopC
LTLSCPVRELRLYYTQGVVTAFSAVSVTNSTGGSVPASRPVNDPSDQQTVIIRLGRALTAGTYTVSWHVVSVYERMTSGTFHFTVS